MEKYLSSTIQGIINATLPMVLITIVVAVLLRLTYLIKNKMHITLYKELTSNNFIPFKEILRYHFGSHLFMRNVIGNVLLFVPFGYFISYILKSEKVYLPLLITFITSLTIEFVQLSIGRVFDVDDVMLNLIGGGLGFLIYYIFMKIYDKLPKVFKNEIFLDILSVILLFIVIYIFMF